MLSYLVYLFLFLAVLLLVAGAWLAWQAARGPSAARVARRLQSMYTASDGEQALSITKQRPLSAHAFLHGVLEGLPGARRLDQLLLQAGMRWFVATFLGYCALGGMAGLLLAGALPLPWYVRLGLGAGGAALPYLLARRARSQQCFVFDSCWRFSHQRRGRFCLETEGVRVFSDIEGIHPAILPQLALPLRPAPFTPPLP